MADPFAYPPIGPSAPGVPSVAVLVELARGPAAGGHVKCWERFADAAARLEPAELGIDLTVYVLGRRRRVEPWSPAVRLVSLRPLLSTAPFVRRTGSATAGADAADLAPYHPQLARLLPRHDVWHLTHTFAFAATAARLARRQRHLPPERRAGVVGSVHTDVPALTAAYVRQLTGPATGSAGGSVPLLGPLLRHLPPARSPEALAAALARRRRDRVLRICSRVLVATPSQREEIAAVVGEDRVALLGRGIDRERFRPDPAARGALAAAYGVPEDRPAVLFVGRVDASKRALLAAEAVARLRGTGRRVHLVVVGSGSDSRRVAELLGEDVTLLGPLAQEHLAQVYAACDVFAFPSRTETVGNVVAEAMACELPVVLPAGARTTGWLARPGADGVTVGRDDAAGWAAALAWLVDEPERRAAMGSRAGVTARERHRSWEQVLADDLLPLWRWVAPPRRAATHPARRGPIARAPG